jgi:hypothetical protein
MNASELSRPGRSPRVWWGTLVLVAQILGIVLVAPRHSSDPMRVMLAAIIGAAGTLVMALVLAPLSRVPRVAYWITAGLYAAFILVSPALSPTPQSWIEFMRPQLWYLPWFFLIVVSESPRPRATGHCATISDRSGVMLVGIALLFLGIVTFAMKLSTGRH